MEHRKLALEAARKSIVLLKNENQTLPLKSSVRKIAVIGPSADDPEALLGNYNGFSSKQVSPLEGIQRQFSGKAEIRFALGSTYTSISPALIPSDVLTPPDGNGHGLLAEYFASPDLQGEPRLKRVEPRPYIQPGISDPAVPLARYSVRWSGTLRAPVAGDYVLGSRGNVKVFLDDKELVADNMGPGSAAGRQTHTHLDAGRAYNLRVECLAQRVPGPVRLFWIPPAEGLLAEAVDAVKKADVTLAFVGLNPNLEGEEMRINVPGFAGGDRTDLNLPAPQEKLIEAAIATGKPVVVVLTSGSALAVNYAAEHAAALLEAWYAGEEAGTAIAETLAGVNNPAGRLPVTFYRGVDQLPPFEDYSMKNRTYRYFKGEPLYGFGFGLSYSQFQYSRLRGERTAKGARIVVRVKNDSMREGDEVVQLYFNGAGAADDPIRQLRGFQRIHLRAGESRDVEFTIAAEDLPKNKVRMSVGGGQPVGRISHVEGVL